MLKVSDRKVILYRFKFIDFVFDRSFMKICFKKKYACYAKLILALNLEKKKQGIVWYEVYFYLTIIVIFLLNLECF